MKKLNMLGGVCQGGQDRPEGVAGARMPDPGENAVFEVYTKLNYIIFYPPSSDCTRHI
jgi:hypothetical protein